MIKRNILLTILLLAFLFSVGIYINNIIPPDQKPIFFEDDLIGLKSTEIYGRVLKSSCGPNYCSYDVRILNANEIVRFWFKESELESINDVRKNY